MPEITTHSPGPWLGFLEGPCRWSHPRTVSAPLQSNPRPPECVRHRAPRRAHIRHDRRRRISEQKLEDDGRTDVAAGDSLKADHYTVAEPPSSLSCSSRARSDPSDVASLLA